MKIRRFLVFFCLSILTLTSCTTVQHGINKIGYQKIDEANSKIAQVEASSAQKQTELQNQLNQENAKILKVYIDQAQGAVDELFAAHYGYILNPNPDRSATVIDFHIQGAQQFLKLAPTPAAIQKHLVEVKQDLDITKTSMADLQKKYDAVKVQADVLEKQKQETITQIDIITKEKTDVEKKKNDDIKKIQADKDIATKGVLDAAQAKIDNDNKQKELIKRLMYWTGALAVIAMIAAVYIPLMRREAGVVALILGGVTVALPFLEAWHVAAAGAVAIVSLIAWMIYKHDKQLTSEKTVSNNLVNVIQDVKEKSKEVFDSLVKPSLEQWNTKYVKDSKGNVTTVPDTSVEAAIDQKLVESQRK